MTSHRPKVGFVFSTKDRVDFTRCSIQRIDAEAGFDLIWVDGSDTLEGKALPRSYPFRNCRLVEVHYVTGGPDQAICFGLRRLLSLGYEFCGLIENDVALEPGWFGHLMPLFQLGWNDGFEVGAATVRNVESRVLVYRQNYTINHVVGAGMVLFSRRAAKLVLATYGAVGSKRLGRFFRTKFHVDLGHVWELWMDRRDRSLGCDWSYAMRLYAHGLIAVGSIPSKARNLDLDFEQVFKTRFVFRGQPVSELPRLKIGWLARLRLIFCQDAFPLPLFFLWLDMRRAIFRSGIVVKRLSRTLRFRGGILACFQKLRLWT